MLNETAEQDKTKDVDVHYVSPRVVGKAGSVCTDEAIMIVLSDTLTMVIKYCVVVFVI